VLWSLSGALWNPLAEKALHPRHGVKVWSSGAKYDGEFRLGEMDGEVNIWLARIFIDTLCP
jgi:hypothetical protein